MKKTIVFFLLAIVTHVTILAQLPNIQLKDIQGKTLNVNTLKNGGKPIIISFFATWCKPCIRELKAIHEVYPDWQDETGVKVILVSIDQGQDVQKVKPLVDGFGWDFDVLLDPDWTFKRAMNVQEVPHVFVLNGKGTIIYNHKGYTDGQEENLYKLIKK